MITEKVFSYSSPFDIINICSVNKYYYKKMDEYLLMSKEDDNFLVLNEGEYFFNDIDFKKYTIGVGTVIIKLEDENFKNCKNTIKNIEFELSKPCVINDSTIFLEDCILNATTKDAVLDILSSNVCMTFCCINKFQDFCMAIDSDVNFFNTCFNEVSAPIVGMRTRSDIFDCRFIKCKDSVSYIDKFRVVLRNTLFLDCQHSIFIHSEKNKNHLEIGTCLYSKTSDPIVKLESCRNFVDIYSNSSC